MSALDRLLERVRRRVGWATVGLTVFIATNGPANSGLPVDRRLFAVLALVCAAGWLALWVVTELRQVTAAERVDRQLDARAAAEPNTSADPPVGECPDQRKGGAP